MFSQAFRVLALLWLAACSCRCVLRVPRLFARLQIATLVPVSFALPTVAVAFAQRLVGSPPLAPVLKQALWHLMSAWVNQEQLGRFLMSVNSVALRFHRRRQRQHT